MIDTLSIECLSIDEVELSLYKEISILLQLAFKERLENGLNFTCALFSPQDVRIHTKGKYIFIARDSDFLVAVMTLNVVKERGHMEYVAVHPDYKGCGIAMKLFQYMENYGKSLNLNYITSTTACKAISSIRWHKKMGFLTYGLGSDSQTNYYSYLFIKQLNGKGKWSNPFFVRMIYNCYYIAIHIIKKKNGELTLVGKFLLKVKKLL